MFFCCYYSKFCFYVFLFETHKGLYKWYAKAKFSNSEKFVLTKLTFRQSEFFLFQSKNFRINLGKGYFESSSKLAGRYW